MTPQQIKLIHIFKSQAGLNDQQYRMVLGNIASVSSCKDLSNDQYEDCMAFLEEQIESAGGHPGGYWRDKLAQRGNVAGARMVWKIRQLHSDYNFAAEAADIAPDDRYQLSGLVERAANGRTRRPEQLTPKEAWNLIEGLKKMVTRTAHDASHPVRRHPTADPSYQPDPSDSPAVVPVEEIPF